MLSLDCLFRMDFFSGLSGVRVEDSDFTMQPDETSILESSKRILATEELLVPVTWVDVADIPSEFQVVSRGSKGWWEYFSNNELLPFGDWLNEAGNSSKLGLFSLHETLVALIKFGGCDGGGPNSKTGCRPSPMLILMFCCLKTVTPASFCWELMTPTCEEDLSSFLINSDIENAVDENAVDEGDTFEDIFTGIALTLLEISGGIDGIWEWICDSMTFCCCKNSCCFSNWIEDRRRSSSCDSGIYASKLKTLHLLILCSFNSGMLSPGDKCFEGSKSNTVGDSSLHSSAISQGESVSF